MCPAAAAINRAALGLSIDGRTVLEVGAGVGHLSGFILERGFRLVTTEARPENVDELRRRCSDVRSEVADVEASLSALGRFEIVHCYGLLYHLESPVRALRNMAKVRDDLLLIETVVCDSPLPVARLDDEYLGEPRRCEVSLTGRAQAMWGWRSTGSGSSTSTWPHSRPTFPTTSGRLPATTRSPAASACSAVCFRRSAQSDRLSRSRAADLVIVLLSVTVQPYPGEESFPRSTRFARRSAR